MQRLSELLAKAEAKGVRLFARGTRVEKLHYDITLLAIVAWLAERGVAVRRFRDGSWGIFWPDDFDVLAATDFRTAVLAAFDRELDSMEKPNDAR